MHHIADTIRSGGDIDISSSGKLESRCANVAMRVLGGISELTGIGGESISKIKISKESLPQVIALVFKVAGTDKPGAEFKQVQQDLKDVKSYLAEVCFGQSLNFIWTELLIGIPLSSSITLTSFAQSHQNLIGKFIEVDTSSRLSQVDPYVNRKCAKLFFQLVQRAIKEGEKGRYHIEYSLLLHAELLMTRYYCEIMNPNVEKDELNHQLMAIYSLIMEAYERILQMGDDFYLKLGFLDIQAIGAEGEAYRRIKMARKLGMEEPFILLSRALESLETTELTSTAIQDALARLQELPQNEKVSQVRTELISALRLQAFSSLRFGPENLQTRWCKEIFIQLLKNRIPDFLSEANYHHKRVASHYHNLQSKMEILTDQINVAKSLEKELMAASSNIWSSKNLTSVQESLKKLNTDLQEVKEQIEKLVLCLKSKKIEPEALNHLAQEEISIHIDQIIKQSDQVLTGYTDIELDQQIEELKKARSFLKQRSLDLEEVLKDPWRDMYD